MKTKHKFIIALFVSLVILTIEFMRIPVFDNLDSLFNRLKFKFRGKQQVDTSFVFLYIDDNAIHSLGGYPLKRTYYALLIDLLTQLNVKAIMIDILLTDKNPDYPERDNLLVLTVKNSNRVYLGGSFINFDGLKYDETNYPESLKKFLIKPNVQRLNFHKGINFRPPFDELLKSCAGLGHLNYIQNDSHHEIPLLVQVSQDLYLPSISLELARIYYGIPRDSIKVFESSIILGDVKIPIKNGTMLINHTGGTDALKMYSILDFIKSYDAIKSGLKPEIDLNSFKDKIVFIGIYSEALGQTIRTPFQDKFPTTGLHIMALNTIVQKKFLTETTPILNFAISLLFSLLILHLLSLGHILTAFRILLFQFTVISALLLILLLLFKLGISVSVYPLFATSRLLMRAKSIG